jgi:glycine cleavage system transcriptional repressor
MEVYMKKQAALSAIGQDQPGIVAGLTKVLFEKGCNLEDSSMTLLKGDFAVLLLITLPEGLEVQELNRAVKPVADSLGLTIVLRELMPGEIRETSGGGSYTLVVYGADRPGIVYKVTRAAAGHGLNITDLRTHVTGEGTKPVYSLVMDVEAPSRGTADIFRMDLEDLKAELKVNISFHPTEAEEL